MSFCVLSAILKFKDSQNINYIIAGLVVVLIIVIGLILFKKNK